ncbi:ubiquitin C-terminal hydrolase 12-like [Hevea brasiliensis]|uniref:ubiquitin C-terminal hydrolase 12-like n=1 Tax=Hevea brasiliensis TaxID=3981 RepID=UPI0025E20E0B|nr:ubiquitin C-terminal hydrolase 12-like [Hevea brasiliensis]
MAEGKAMCNAAPFKFTWRINEFSKWTEKLYSEHFSAGGCKWRLAIYPKGNHVNYLSIYLEVAYRKNLPEGWSTEVKFSLAVVNQINSRSTVRKDTQKQIVFNASGKNWSWGFASFIPLSKLKNPSEGYLVGDSLMVEAEVLVYNVQQYSSMVYTEKDVARNESEPAAATASPSSQKDTEAKTEEATQATVPTSDQNLIKLSTPPPPMTA